MTEPPVSPQTSINNAAREQPRRGGGPAQWAEDLAPITAADWSYDLAAHLLERAGFGGTPEEIARLAAMTPAAGRRPSGRLSSPSPTTISRRSIASGVWDPGLRDFPPSRPAATQRARADRRGDGREGQARGRAPAPAGGRPLLLLAARHRASKPAGSRNWWADRMVATQRPLEEKMALFWHGHFATGEEKVRDYRKMEQQLALFHRQATGNFRELLVAVARDPAMLAFLDAAREREGRAQREFRPRGHGALHHGRRQLHRARHPRGRPRLHRLDRRRSHLQGRSGKARRRPEDLPRPHRQFRRRRHSHDHPRAEGHGGVHRRQALSLLRARGHIAGRCRRRLGAVLRDNDYEIAPLLRTMFLSRDFYSAPSFGTRIKGPIELVVSTYRKLGVKRLPGIPDLYRRQPRTRADAAQSADGRRLGAGPRLDHAGAAARARQFRPRRAVSRRHQLRRPELQSGRRDQAGQRPHPRRHGHPQATIEDGPAKAAAAWRAAT